MDGNYYWKPGSIICGKVCGGEMECDDLSLDAYHWAFVCSLLCGGGPFCVNKNFGVGDVVCTNSLIHPQFMQFAVDCFFSILESFVVD